MKNTTHPKPNLITVSIWMLFATRLFGGSVTFPLPSSGAASGANFLGPKGNEVVLTDNSGKAVVDSTYGMFLPRCNVSFSLQYNALDGWSSKDDETISVNLKDEQVSKIISKAWFVKPHVMDPDGSLAEARDSEYIEASVNVVDLYIGDDGYPGLGTLDSPPSPSSSAASSTNLAANTAGTNATPTNVSRPFSVNTGDLDNDGIPNYADFGANASPNFIPIGIYLKGLDSSKVKVKFAYSASNPSNVGSAGTGYRPDPSGDIRLWKKDGPSQRNPAAVTSGDYIPPNTEITPSGLSMLGEGHYIAYAEAVSASHNTTISISIDPAGDGHWMSIDSVTLLPLEIVPDNTSSNSNQNNVGRTTVAGETTATNGGMTLSATPGDMVPSNKGGGGERHFVSPKKSTEIPDDYVTVKVVGPTTQQFQSLLDWDGGGEDVPGEPLKRRIKRDATEVQRICGPNLY